MKLSHIPAALRKGIALLAASSVLTLGLPMPVQAITTPGVITGTAAGLASCLSYRVEGVCFFLRCKLAFCWIETSIKISHYVPDVVVSTYNDPIQHPWTDIGKIVATVMNGASSTIYSRLFDSSGAAWTRPQRWRISRGRTR
ncbi:TraU family protein [Paracidovorax avenae]|uniref:TraU family protein n=1 Tax=Paracidovorax avenae TaxID=80867 RepID=UPI001CEF9158|nr:TraU family protein [Paracidovorax avenae]